MKPDSWTNYKTTARTPASRSLREVPAMWQNQGRPPDSNVESVLIGTEMFMTHAVNSKAPGEQRQPNTFVLMYQHHTCHCSWYDLAMKAAPLDWLAWEHCCFRQNKIRVKQALWRNGVQIRHTVTRLNEQWVPHLTWTARLSYVISLIWQANISYWPETLHCREFHAKHCLFC